MTSLLEKLGIWLKENETGGAKLIASYWKKPELSHFSSVKTKLSEKSDNYALGNFI